jgi:hypothetical protein
VVELLVVGANQPGGFGVENLRYCRGRLGWLVIGPILRIQIPAGLQQINVMANALWLDWIANRSILEMA